MEENNNEKVRKGSLEVSESQEEIVQQEINEQESIQEEIKEENNENVVEEKADEYKEEIKKEEPKNLNIQAKAKKEVKPKKKINKQVILVAIIVIACIVITVGLIVLKMRELNKKYQYVEESDVFTTEDKVEDPDAIYATDNNTRYDYNEITYKKVYTVDGKIVEALEPYFQSKEYTNMHQYIEINGLKDKEIENKINNDIKEFIFNCDFDGVNGKKEIYSTVKGNFSNILSIEVTDYHEYFGLNYNLITGERLEFKDLFVKSAPIKLILGNEASKTDAWIMDIPDNLTGEDYYAARGEQSDMNNRDGSEHEKILLEVSKLYDKLNGNLDYTVSPYQITVYNAFPEYFKDDSSRKAYSITIPMYSNMEYIAIFKRYAGKDIYETSNTKIKGIRATSMPMGYYSGCEADYSIYGDLSNNLFCDISRAYYGEVYDNYKVLDSAYSKINEIVNEQKNIASQDMNNSYVIQGTVEGYITEKEKVYVYANKIVQPHIEIIFQYAVTKMPNEEFSRLNYHLGKLANNPYAGAGAIKFQEYYVSDMPNVEVNNIYQRWFFDLDANYLGDTEDVVSDRLFLLIDPS